MRQTLVPSLIRPRRVRMDLGRTQVLSHRKVLRLRTSRTRIRLDCTDTLLTYASYTWSWWPKTDAQWEEMAHGIEADPDQHFWDEFEK